MDEWGKRGIWRREENDRCLDGIACEEAKTPGREEAVCQRDVREADRVIASTQEQEEAGTSHE